MRRLLELIARNKILKRKLPKRYGGDHIYVSPDAALKFWSARVENYDPMLWQVCEELVKPGAIVWDVGANVGLFTFPAACLAGEMGRVVAIEPDSFCVDLLRKSVANGKSQRAKIDVLSFAISEQVGISEFNIASRCRSTNFLSGSVGPPDAGGIREVQTVLTVTLDWLLDYCPAPTVLKIDVEGLEYKVLNGASRLLREIKPIIFCEVISDKAKVSCFFKKNGYTLTDVDGFNLLARPCA